MPGNQIGQVFRVTTFGESHGKCIGVVIDGCPAGLEIDYDFIQAELDRRRPGQSKITTQRQESDQPEFVSGIFEGKTTGAPLCALIPNKDARPGDYDHLEDQFRPSHADFTYEMKYGNRDHRGGGRSSARETAARVIAGAVAKLFLRHSGISIHAFVSQVGSIGLTQPWTELDLSQTNSNLVRCPDPVAAEKMIELIQKVRSEGDTIGGIVTASIQGCPPGLGDPVFDRLHADLGKAMLSINAVKGFEYGSGFKGIELRGSEHNDAFTREAGNIRTLTNHSGGIQGGISNGMEIYFRVAFKPVATIMKPQASINKQGEETTIQGRGRHDPCVVPRAVPIVEAMAAITLADHLLRSRLSTVRGMEK
ncbi:MAG: chorismate synthase [Bdellovibrionia bacterium]